MNGTEQSSNTVVQDGVKASESQDSWTSVLPESYRSDPSITKYKNIDEFVQGYKSANEFIGKSIRIPDSANEEELNKFYNKLGRPDKPESYKSVDNLKKVLHEDGLKQFLSAAHKAGMLDHQVEAVTNFYTEMESKKLQQAEAEKSNAETTLKKLWGKDYDSNLSSVGNTLKTYGSKYGKEAVEALASNIGNNVPLIVMLHDLSLTMKGKSEDTHVTGEGSTTFGGLSSDEAKSKIKEIRADLSHAYHNSTDKEHSKAVKEMQELYSAAYRTEKEV